MIRHEAMGLKGLTTDISSFVSPWRVAQQCESEVSWQIAYRGMGKALQLRLAVPGAKLFERISTYCHAHVSNSVRRFNKLRNIVVHMFLS